MMPSPRKPRIGGIALSGASLLAATLTISSVSAQPVSIDGTVAHGATRLSPVGHAGRNIPPPVHIPMPFDAPPLSEPAVPPPSASQPAFVSPAVIPGSWLPVGHKPPFAPGSVFLLTNGEVLAQDSDLTNVAWWVLVPNNDSYLDGSWSKVNSPPNCPNNFPGASADTVYSPLYYASAVLPDGRFVMIGGEYNYNYKYGLGGSTQVHTSQGAIYNPVTNSWTCIAPPTGWNQIGDAQSVVLPNGTLMIANPFNNQVATLNVNTNPPTFNKPFTPPGKSADQYNDEEAWTLLPNGSVLSNGSVLPDGSFLTLEIYNRNDLNETPALVYNPSKKKWISASSAPQPLVNLNINPANNAPYAEIGPATLSPNGTVFAEGATGFNDIYYPSYGIWAIGPSFPTVSGPGTEQLEAVDAPAALLPDGNVLVAASPIYAAPTEFFEFDGSNLTDVPAPPNAVNDSSYVERLLVLPTGQVLFTDGTQDVEVYSSIGFFNPSWAPTITSSPSDVTPGGTNYTLEGTQLNGLSQAVSYGDDYQAATNYPLVAIQNNRTLDVNFARTHSFSTMAVATGDTSVSTKFDVVDGTPLGPSTLYVIANGIESTGVSVNVTSTQLPPVLQITPTTLTFPNTVVGGTSAVETVKLTNPHSSTNAVSIENISHSTPTSFYVSAPTCGTLAPGNSCTISVAFIPNAPTKETETLSITDNAQHSPQTVLLSGTGVPPTLQVTPTTLTFPNTPVGALSNSQTVTLTNPSPGTPVSIEKVSTSNDALFPYAYFQCPAVLPVGGSCPISVFFSPNSATKQTGTLTITDSAQGSPQTVALSGTGVAPTLGIAPAKLTFPETLAGHSSQPLTVTLTATQGPVHLQSITTPDLPAAFTQTNNCPVPGTLETFSSCAISVTFTPNAIAEQGQLLITDNASGSPQTVILLGIGEIAMLSAAPATLNFGNLLANHTSAPKTVTLTNKGNLAAQIAGVTVPAPFKIAGGANTCAGETINPDGTCSFDVEYAPTIAGSASQASVEVTYNGTSPAITVDGVSPQVGKPVPH